MRSFAEELEFRRRAAQPVAEALARCPRYAAYAQDEEFRQETQAVMSLDQRRVMVSCMELLNVASAKSRKISHQTGDRFSHLQHAHTPVNDAAEIIRQVAETVLTSRFDGKLHKELKLRLRSANALLKSADLLLESYWNDVKDFVEQERE